MSRSLWAHAVLASSMFAATCAHAGRGTLEMRFVNILDDGTGTNLNAEPIVAGQPAPFILQVRQVGDTDANGVVALDPLLSDDDAGGTFTAAELSVTEYTFIAGLEATPSGFLGTFRNFRAYIQGNNDNPANGGEPALNGAGNIELLPTDLAQGGRGDGEGVWINVYKLTYTPPVDVEQVTIHARANSGGYWDTARLIQPVDVADAQYTIDVTTVECPCDADGNGVVEFSDLLEFLGGWFDEAASADLNGDGSTNLVDLLDFLECWFTAQAAGECVA